MDSGLDQRSEVHHRRSQARKPPEEAERRGGILPPHRTHPLGRLIIPRLRDRGFKSHPRNHPSLELPAEAKDAPTKQAQRVVGLSLCSSFGSARHLFFMRVHFLRTRTFVRDKHTNVPLLASCGMPKQRAIFLSSFDANS